MRYLLNKYFVVFTSCLAIYIILTEVTSIQLTNAQVSPSTTNQSSNKTNLLISNITLGENPTGLTSVNGVVINNSTEILSDVKIDVILYDKENNIVQQTSRFVTAPFSTFGPGSTEEFRFLMIAENFDHYNATSYGEKFQ